MPLAGDRTFADDAAVIGGLGRFRGRTIVVIGNEKGGDTEERLHHNFGMARPEGYRKVQRLMKLADHFGLPVVTLVDTPGAYPGIDAEARGQARPSPGASRPAFPCASPWSAWIIGEGGSGGAIALAAANTVIMLEHAILFGDFAGGMRVHPVAQRRAAEDAAEALKLAAGDLEELGVIDEVVPEPLGGAHRLPEATISGRRRRRREGAGQALLREGRQAEVAAARKIPQYGLARPGLSLVRQKRA